MTMRAPEMAAPCTLLRPTPPAPMTAAVAPGRRAAVLVTAPKPVMTPQASNDAASSGMEGGMTTT